jgi:hypothetical protein
MENSIFLRGHTDNVKQTPFIGDYCSANQKLLLEIYKPFQTSRFSDRYLKFQIQRTDFILEKWRNSYWLININFGKI